MQKSMAMAKEAVEAGITDLFATPHHLNERYVNVKDNIIDRVFELNECLQQENIPLSVHPGQELRIHRELFVSLEKGEVLTLDNTDKYLLLELPSGHVPTYTQELIYELVLKGITPIIVHPERNKELLKNHNLLFKLVHEGALTQLTSGSIIGLFGKNIKSFSKKLLNIIWLILLQQMPIILPLGDSLYKRLMEQSQKYMELSVHFISKKMLNCLSRGKVLLLKNQYRLKENLRNLLEL